MAIGVLEIDADGVRLLVADAEAGSLYPRLSRRVPHPEGGFPGRSEILLLVEAGAEEAHAYGAETVIVCGTQAISGTHHERALRYACNRTSCRAPRLLPPGQRADLAFLGATATSGEDLDGTVAVIDLSGDATKIALGETGVAPSWRGSRPVGAGRLNERALLSDPPTPDQLAAARNAVGRRLMRMEPPRADHTLLASSGSAVELVCGRQITRADITDALERLLFVGTGGLAAELDIDSAMLRALPAELLVLEALCDFVPEPINAAPGGVLEALALLAAEERTTTR